MALTLAALGRTKDALALYARFGSEHRRSPLAPAALLYAGTLCAGPRVGDFKEAREWFAKTAANHPGTREAVAAEFYTATLAWRDRKWIEAERLHKAFAASHPDSPLARVALDERLPAIAKKSLAVPLHDPVDRKAVGDDDEVRGRRAGRERRDVLREELAKLVDRIRPRPRKGPYFLPIDRVFPVAGFGAVVTGTAYRGEISSGQEGTVLPAGKECRIRSVQVHGTGVQTAWAGQRVAVNVAGISSEDLSRGDVLCARGVYARTRCFECELHLVESAGEPVQHWQRVRLHIGTSDVVARISLLESPVLQPGETAAAQVVVEEDIVCLVEQRFVLRRYSPLETIAGGRVLFPYAVKPRGKSARQVCIKRIMALSSLSSQEERLLALIRSFARLELPDAARFLQETPAETLRFGERLQKNGDAVFLQGEKKLFLSRERFSSETLAVEEFLSSYHSSHPSRKGAPSDQIALQALKDLDPRASRAFLEALSENGTVVMDEGTVRMADFTPRDDKAFEKKSQALLDFCRKRDFQPPLLSEAMDAAGLDEKAFSLLIKGMREAGLVSIVSDEFLFSSEIEEKLLKILLQEKDDITIAKVRDITGSSRKFILPLLEYLDARGYTRRAGDRRGLLASKLPASIRAQSQ